MKKLFFTIVGVLILKLYVMLWQTLGFGLLEEIERHVLCYSTMRWEGPMW